MRKAIVITSPFVCSQIHQDGQEIRIGTVKTKETAVKIRRYRGIKPTAVNSSKITTCSEGTKRRETVLCAAVGTRKAPARTGNFVPSVILFLKRFTAHRVCAWTGTSYNIVPLNQFE